MNTDQKETRIYLGATSTYYRPTKEATIKRMESAKEVFERLQENLKAIEHYGFEQWYLNHPTHCSGKNLFTILNELKPEEVKPALGIVTARLVGFKEPTEKVKLSQDNSAKERFKEYGFRFSDFNLFDVDPELKADLFYKDDTYYIIMYKDDKILVNSWTRLGYEPKCGVDTVDYDKADDVIELMIKEWSK